jgi:diadenosine tetraphosphate (Ap4A) HIT family hydrolase
MKCPICSWTPESQDYLLLHTTQYWRICLAPNQSLLGTCVVSLQRHAGDLADLTEIELVEFLDVLRKLEAAVRSAFGAPMFNWSCYMNHAYRETIPDPHVHWWAVPRYDRNVEYEGQTFEDPHFGNPYDHDRVRHMPKESRLAITKEIKTHLLSLKESNL